MLLKTEINLVKSLGSILCLAYLCMPQTYAQDISCTQTNTATLKVICNNDFTPLRQALDERSLTTYLITDAPIRLIQDTQILWWSRLENCKSFDCYKQQFEDRLEQLNIFTSLNQSLTQHYLKYENGVLQEKNPIHLQVHQLDKNNLKIEGLAYKNPNNTPEKRGLAFLAYTTTDQKTLITNNENNCIYTFSYSKAYLTIKSDQKKCRIFNGIYRLYD